MAKCSVQRLYTLTSGLDWECRRQEAPGCFVVKGSASCQRARCCADCRRQVSMRAVANGPVPVEPVMQALVTSLQVRGMPPMRACIRLHWALA